MNVESHTSAARPRRARIGRTLALAALLATAASAQGCFVYGSRNFAVRYGGSMPIDLVNDLGVTVCYIQMGPSTEPNWGGDWLGPSETMPPGSVRRFGIFGAVSWDIRALDCGHRVLVMRQGIPLAGPSTISLRMMTVVGQ